MVAGLPLFKLASLAIKQSAKPVANVIKRGAKESDLFKKYLCYYPGQGKWLQILIVWLTRSQSGFGGVYHIMPGWI